MDALAKNNMTLTTSQDSATPWEYHGPILGYPEVIVVKS